jgi:hypothetical protein
MTPTPPHHAVLARSERQIMDVLSRRGRAIADMVATAPKGGGT